MDADILNCAGDNGRPFRTPTVMCITVEYEYGIDVIDISIGTTFDPLGLQ